MFTVWGRRFEDQDFTNLEGKMSFRFFPMPHSEYSFTSITPLPHLSLNGAAALWGMREDLVRFRVLWNMASRQELSEVSYISILISKEFLKE